MVELLLVAGLLVAAFVGYNIGGSSTGVAFGPAVGSRILGPALAAGLFTSFALLGGWTVGRNVIETMSGGIVPESQFSLFASVVVLLFAGLSLLLANIYGVPASTSMTAVGAIVGLGVATGRLNESLMLTIVSAWIVAPLSAFLVGLVIGRYLYPYLDAIVAFSRSGSSLLVLDRTGTLPLPRLGSDTTVRDVVGSAVVVTIACYMAFSAGASNAANAVAPLVGNGAISIETGILLAIGSIGLGGFTIARRTLATVGDGITNLPILAALLVSVVGATIITVLSRFGIPASLAVSTTSCIIGLGWGRASRAITLAEAATAPMEEDLTLATGALAADSESDDPAPPSSPTVETLAQAEEVEPESPAEVPPIGEEEFDDLAAESLFDAAVTARIVLLWILSPTISSLGSFLLFVVVY